MSVLIGGLLQTDRSSRCIVRTSAGKLYVIAVDVGGAVDEIAVLYSADGISWVEKDAANRPSSNNSIMNYATAIDGNGLIHIFYHRIIDAEFNYTTFDTTTDQYNSGNPANVELVALVDETYPIVQNRCAISIDFSNKPHVVWHDGTKSGGTIYGTVYYSNRIAGTWKTAIQVEGATAKKHCYGADITINGADIPLIVFQNASDEDITAAHGTWNDPVQDSFVLKDVDVSVKLYTANDPTIAVDKDDKAWVAFVDSDDSIVIAKQSGNWVDDWLTYDSEESGLNPSIVIVDNIVYIFYENGSDDVCYNRYNGSYWKGETLLAEGTWRYVTGRWAYYHSFPIVHSIDIVFSTDTFGSYYECVKFPTPVIHWRQWHKHGE